MHWFLRSILRSSTRAKYRPSRQAYSERYIHGSTKMSTASTSAALYAAVVSSSQATGAVPEEANELRHHLKDDKGFVNPWDSYREMSAFRIVRALIW